MHAGYFLTDKIATDVCSCMNPEEKSKPFSFQDEIYNIVLSPTIDPITYQMNGY